MCCNCWKKITCAGIRWVNLSPWLFLLEELGLKPATTRRRFWPSMWDDATGKLLDNNKSPSRRTVANDNRRSQFYLAMYWRTRHWPHKPRMPNCRPVLHRWPKHWLRTSSRSSTSLKAVQGKPADIGVATTCRIRKSVTPSCVRAQRCPTVRLKPPRLRSTWGTLRPLSSCPDICRAQQSVPRLALALFLSLLDKNQPTRFS